MSEIIFCADIHLGVPNRLNDCVWTLRVVREYANRHDINTIISLGDLFHDRESIGIDVLCAAYDFFTETKYKHNQRWLTFPGNHDMYLKFDWSINSLKPLQNILTIIDTVKIIKINDIRFWVLPFIHYESAYMRVLKRIEDRSEDGDILLTHIGVAGAIKNVCFLLKDWSIVSFENSPFKQVYTGHFHSMQQIGSNVYYPGSLIPFKFDEGDCQHGFFVYDLETRSHKFIDIWDVGQQYFPNEIAPPNYFTIAEESLNEITTNIATNNILRVATTKDYTPAERSDIEDHLVKLGARSVRWLNLAVDDDYRRAKQNIIESDGDMFEMWLKVDSKNLSGLDVDLLRQLNDDVKKEGDEIYNYEGDE